MKCPYCNIGMRFEVRECCTYPTKEYSITNLGLELSHGFCPECEQLIVLLKHGRYRWTEDGDGLTGELVHIQKEEILYPQIIARAIDQEVPEQYRQDFNEANSVLTTSPKASAALSRRLLQSILRDEYKINNRDLSRQIDEFIQLQEVPSEVTGAVDAVRNIGNFAAHPLKYTNSGEIVEVEPGEAEWLLDVLEVLFDVTFIRPKRDQERKEKLNKKLAALGKPPMKSN